MHSSLTPVATGRASRPVRSMVVDRAFDQTVLVSEASGLGPVRDAELAIDVGQVELDGLFRDPELLADRLVREASRDGREDRCLALRQAGGPCRVVARLG